MAVCFAPLVPWWAVSLSCLFEGFGVAKANRACALAGGRPGSLLEGSHGTTSGRSSLPFGCDILSLQIGRSRENSPASTPSRSAFVTLLLERCPDIRRRD